MQDRVLLILMMTLFVAVLGLWGIKTEQRISDLEHKIGAECYMTFYEDGTSTRTCVTDDTAWDEDETI